MKSRNNPPRDFAQEVTNRIIEKLEQGVKPWVRPWSAAGGGRPLRFNGQPYSGVNLLNLWMIGDACGYSSRYWMTYNQALELKGQVRKGERGSLSVYSSTINRTEQNPVSLVEKTSVIRFLRSYVVFNADQIDGLPSHFYSREETTAPSPSERDAEIAAFFDPIPAEIRLGGNQAYYSVHGDYIQLPRPNTFKSADLFASTKAHELSHWAGGPTRLARQFGKRFGDAAYSLEELVAELSASFCCVKLGLANELMENHASYIDHWIRVLKKDKTAIIHAASQAEKAFNYLSAYSAAETIQAEEPAEERELCAA